MLVFPRPARWAAVNGSTPKRRRVIVVGATAAGISVANHLGDHAMLIEQRMGPVLAMPNAELAALAGALGVGVAVRLWEPPRFDGETRGDVRVIAVHVPERRLQISTGESFVYDKLVSALPMQDLQRLIAGETPSRLNSDESWRHWLNARDVELLDEPTQRSFGDRDGEAAGKRVADAIRIAMTMKYSTKSAFKNRASALFHPRIVSSRPA